jgi:hypothetical protein
MDVNEHDRLSKITLKTEIKIKELRFYLRIAMTRPAPLQRLAVNTRTKRAAKIK